MRLREAQDDEGLEDLGVVEEERQEVAASVDG